MSAQFGRWNFSGQPIDKDYLNKVAALLARFGPDGRNSFTRDGVALVFHAFHTTKEAHREKQPYTSQRGAAIAWDGRLDNRLDLIRELKNALVDDPTDLEIAAAAYDKWRERCFGRLIGDWALAIWDPTERSVTLAKDVIGTRHLYYSLDDIQITWCTLLEPLVVLSRKSFQVNEEYIAGWLSFFPEAHLTPYIGVQDVPPSCFVRVQKGKPNVEKYWDFDPGKRIRYANDGEYEEHFRSVFAEAVRRRLRSNAPILAELSGGMDSSSIVCTADTMISCGEAKAPCLDTVSCYDDAEPNWNESPFIALVEAKRGRVGCHIEIDSREVFSLEYEPRRFAALIGSAAIPGTFDRKFCELLRDRQSRVVLSGIGGDELTGGVPSPIPELTDLLARAEFVTLARALKIWALEKRAPWFHLLFEAVGEFAPWWLASRSKRVSLAPWIESGFATRCRAALARYEGRSRLLGPLPSFQQNIKTLDLLRAQVSCYALSPDALHERCYPFLDRDFVEFSLAVPRNQLVRPGQRRSLMRRALTGIVPDEILKRKRKAFVVRAPLLSISEHWSDLLTLSTESRSVSHGFIDSQKFLGALKKASHGEAAPLIPLMRTVALERWLRSLETGGPVSLRMAIPNRPSLKVACEEWASAHGGPDIRTSQLRRL